MKPLTIALLVILLVLIAAMVVLYFLGKKAQKRKEEQDEQIKAAAQTVSMLIIDKKRMRLKDAPLPKAVLEQTPRYARLSKLPIVMARITGAKPTCLIADETIFDQIPVGKQVKATISGLYITAVRGIHGPLPVPEKKKSFRAKLLKKSQEINEQHQKEKAIDDERRKARKK